ncbi:glucose-induced degradation complex subunit FYV10 [Rhodotorula paludigena]|uniref:glucose-induced degradation complex subunit FYV10 n=1 Tax=Rhodotorula paludigena TaxID=86838 RepID=UPI0031785758
MSANKLVPDQVLLLEQATLKAPLDALRRIHKQTQKTYEYNLQPASTLQKDLDALLQQTALQAAASSDHALSDEQRAHMLKSLDGMITRMRGLKRKLADLEGQSNRAVRVVQARLDHLAALPDAIDSPEYPAWARRRLSHHLVDYLLRANPPLKHTAQELAREEGIQDLVDDELWDEMAKVERGLEEGRLDEVLSWVGENRTALKKIKSSLEFRIHLQAYIELCRKRDLLQAITYARKHLSQAAAAELEAPAATEDGAAATTAEPGQTSYMAELQQVLALLAYGPETSCRPYQDLYSSSRWSSLRALFRSTFFTLHSLPSIPLLHMSLQAGIASLKTPICVPVPAGTATAPPSAYPLGGPPLRTMITPDGEIVLEAPGGPAALTPTPAPTTAAASGAATPAPAAAGAAGPGAPPPVHGLEGRPSRECPLCASALRALGPEVPYSHHVNSTIVCGITGKVVEGDGGEGGQLVALVSRVTGEGRVYSKEGLALRASQHPEGKLVEPVTGEVFEWDDLKKVFIS